MDQILPTYDDVLAAAARIAGRVVRTPMIRHPWLDEQTGGTILLKPEPLQRTGSFKFRGATNATLRLNPAQLKAGVVTHSSGNHGAALALAARTRGIPCWVIVPENALASKIANANASRVYSGRATVCRPSSISTALHRRSTTSSRASGTAE